MAMLKTLQRYIVAALVVALPPCMGADGSGEVTEDLVARTAPLAAISPCAVRTSSRNLPGSVRMVKADSTQIGRLEQIRLQGNCSATDMVCLCNAGLAGTDTFEWLLAKCPFPDALGASPLQPIHIPLHSYPYNGAG